MAGPATEEWNLLLEMVSRSFYLTIRALPAPVRTPIGLAYLLARTTDTIADTHLVPSNQRRASLREMRSAIRGAAEGHRFQAPELECLAGALDGAAESGARAECLLLEQAGAVLGRFSSLAPADRRLIRDLMETIVRGQELDLIRFGAAGPGCIVALESDAELEEYTYQVAGCVGEFWTRICRSHLFPAADLDDTALLSDGIRFGKGLQMVNILRDLPRDLRQGRCYLPRPRLAECRMEPAELMDAGVMDRFRPLFLRYVWQARELLTAGWAYTNALPRSAMRIRLACAWPLLIGMRTLALLASGNVLDDRRRIKVGRGEIRRIVLRSIVCYPSRRAWDRMFRHLPEGFT